MASSEWQETTVGKFAPFLYGKALPDKTRDSTGSVPVYGSNGIVGRHSQSFLTGSAIVIGRKGTVGAVNYSFEPCWPIDTTFYVGEASERDLRFTYYLLKSLGLEKMNGDSAVPGLNRDTAHVQKILVPLIGEQRRIAHVLGTLDDKIELNRQLNATLEQLARALFQSWFVDFDPVRAKASGEPADSICRRLGLTPELLALFPAALEESVIGEIPAGWRLGSLGEVVSIFDSKRVPLSSREREARKGIYPYYGAAAIMGHIDDFLFDGVYVLIGEDGSVLNPDGTPITQYAWGKFWVNNHAHVLKGANGLSDEHLLIALKSTNISAFVNGAVQAKLNQANMKRIPFTLAKKPLLEAFGKILKPIFTSIRSTTEESHTLATLRDELLPKLLSGDLRLN